MDTSLNLRPWNDPAITAPEAGDGVFLTSATYGLPIDGRRHLVVDGIAFGSAAVRISANGIITVDGATGASGLFSVALDVPISPEDDAVVVMASNIDSGCSGTDRVVFHWRGAGLISLPAGTLAAVDAERLRYAAGTPDRLKYMKTFVKLANPEQIMLMRRDVYLGNASKGYFVLAHDKVQKGLKEGAKALDGRSLRMGERAVAYERLFTDVFHSLASTAKLDKALAQPKTKATPKKRSTAASGANKDKASAISATRVHSWLPDSAIVVTVSDPSIERLKEAIEDMVNEAKAYWAARRRLGVLFHERLRIRPTNEVFGEAIYKLALTPGEEVQIRQSAETKRRTAFSEISDLESERNTSFSSTWSTDMANTIASQQSSQQSTNIGAGVGVVPEVPISLSGNVGANASEAHGSSEQSTLQQRQEATAASTARMRQQHRIQIEVSVEDNQSFGSTRTLRNHNLQRSQQHTFFKVYRKEQVTLERHDAQLCLRLTVLDPAAMNRATFLAGLEKIDPANLADGSVAKPGAAIELDITKVCSAPTEDPGLHGWWADRWTNHSMDLWSEAVPQGHELISRPVIWMTRCDVFLPRNVLRSTDPNGGAEINPRDSTTFRDGVNLAWDFIREGGQFNWLSSFDHTKNDTSASFKLNRPIQYSGPTLIGEKEVELGRVDLLIETRWGPGGAVLLDYRNKLSEAEFRFRQDFNVDDIRALHQVAKGDYAATVVDKALRENLTFSREFEYNRLKEFFDLESVVVDSVPYWTHANTRSAYEQLHSRLSALPGNLSMAEILTDEILASQATVYLPIRPGYEAEALELLVEAKEQRFTIEGDIDGFRNTHFAPLKPFVAPAMTTHMGPQQGATTPPEGSDWVSEWERPQRNFLILGQWAELVPTDGVHVETQLSRSVVTDEAEADRIGRIMPVE
jgi:hypothetical protein